MNPATDPARRCAVVGCLDFHTAIQMYRALAMLVIAKRFDRERKKCRTFFGKHRRHLPLSGAVNACVGPPLFPTIQIRRQRCVGRRRGGPRDRRDRQGGRRAGVRRAARHVGRGPRRRTSSRPRADRRRRVDPAGRGPLPRARPRGRRHRGAQGAAARRGARVPADRRGHRPAGRRLQRRRVQRRHRRRGGPGGRPSRAATTPAGWRRSSCSPTTSPSTRCSRSTGCCRSGHPRSTTTHCAGSRRGRPGRPLATAARVGRAGSGLVNDSTRLARDVVTALRGPPCGRWSSPPGRATRRSPSRCYDAARAGRRTPPHADRRAHRRVPRARPGQGQPRPRRRRLHLRHGRGQPPPGGHGGGPRRRAARRGHGRPARAAAGDRAPTRRPTRTASSAPSRRRSTSPTADLDELLAFLRTHRPPAAGAPQRPARRAADARRRVGRGTARRRGSTPAPGRCSRATCSSTARARSWSPGDDAGPTARVVAEKAGWPLLAEPSSGCRTATAVIRTYRLLLDGDLGRPRRARRGPRPPDAVPTGLAAARARRRRGRRRPPRGMWAERPFAVDREGDDVASTTP